MLGNPEPVVTEPLGLLRQPDAAGDGISIRRPERTVREVEDVQGDGAQSRGHLKGNARGPVTIPTCAMADKTRR
jgi:hypothetical protein